MQTTTTAAPYLWIAIGGALGSVTRYWCSGMMARLLGPTFPWGTLTVNVAGCCIIGFFAELTAPEGRFLVGPTVRQFVMLGLCGGFTTFSTFSLETLYLARNGEWTRAAANIILSLLLCLAGVWIGHSLAAGYNQMRTS